ncbi:non-specific lipid transfer protein GPI-anchored 14-like [Typha angustifolia]|uniref:non-specific lipid transfer protein GPI-anchored 14-like n=1 Tax=Typha angustifolia TaxID=59011 RepID=UPI003C2D57DC
MALVPCSLLLTLSFLLVLSSIHHVSSDISSDRSECAEQLVGLATCLPYVQGSSKVPTPDCCSGLKQVVGKSPKCLCVLIKDRDNPQLGIKFNVSLALSLPMVCSAPANISECTKLLNLPANSPDAEIFNQSTGGGSTAAQAKGSSTNSGSSGNEGTQSSSGSGRSRYLGGKRSFVSLELVKRSFLLLVLPFVVFI